jgi:hypothetical protein
MFEGKGKQSAELIIHELQQKYSIEAVGYQFNDGWQDVNGEELQFNFSHFSQFVIVTGEHQKISDLGGWVLMVLGYVFGSDMPCSFFAQNTFKASKIFQHLPIMYSPEDLYAFVHEEQMVWMQTHLIERSREALIDQGLGLNEDNLALRVILGDEQNIEHYLRIGFSPDTKDSKGATLAVLAVRNSHLGVLKILKDHAADFNIPSEDRGNTPLMEAALRGNLQMVELLLQRNVDLDQQSKSGQTALMLAVGEGHIEVSLSLINAGAELSAIDQLGMTARKYAELFGHTAVIEAIENQQIRTTVNA